MDISGFIYARKRLSTKPNYLIFYFRFYVRRFGVRCTKANVFSHTTQMLESIQRHRSFGQQNPNRKLYDSCVDLCSIVKRFKPLLCSAQKPLVSGPMIARFAGSAAAVKSEKNYASLWRTERVVSIALMGLFPAALLYSSPVLDTLLALSTSIHVYW